MSLCRKMVSNRHLQRGQKINKKAYTKKMSSKVSVCIFCRPCAGKWHLTDTLRCAQSQNMRAITALRLQSVYQGHFSCTGAAKRQTDTKLLKIYKNQAMLEMSVSFSMSLWRKTEPNRHLRVGKKTVSTKVGAGFGSPFPRACA